MSEPRASFYFDLQSPLAYLAAERVLQALPGAAEWQPVLALELAGARRFEPLCPREQQDVFREEVERRARELGLQPMRWPDPFPFDSTLAMRVATYAKTIGRTVAFAQAAYRQAFAAGRDLQAPDNVLIAAAACEMHPTAVLAAAKLRSIQRELLEATRRAADAGVVDVPAVRVGESVFHGEREIERAAAALSPAAATGRR